MNTIDVLYIFPNTPEPRNEKMVGYIKQLFYVGIMFWKKNPECETYSFPNTPVYEIKVAANDNNPLKRVLPTLKYIKMGIKELRNIKPKCVHVSKLDSLYMVWRYCKKVNDKPKVVYDVSDLHSLGYNNSKNPIKKAIRFLLWRIEKKISKCVNYIFVTSPKFYSDYYSAFYKEEQVVFTPNIPDTNAFKKFEKKREGKYTIGFVGSLRYFKQICNLIDVTKEMDINVMLAGSGIDEEKLRDYANGLTHVSFFGKYDYLKDIKTIYEQIDCVYAVYDTKIKNVKVALPNKLYEGAYCGLPFIVSKGTYLSELVEKYEIGVSCEAEDCFDLKRAIQKVMSISPERVEKGCKAFCDDNSQTSVRQRVIECYMSMNINQ